jgi:NTF2-related export protein 1/2
MSKYYTDESKVIWNGNEVEAKDRQKFQMDLPVCKHYIDCFDVQPILSMQSPEELWQTRKTSKFLFYRKGEFNKTGHYMMLISVSGTCRYTGHDSKLFFQNFMLAAIDDKWKIISDSFRFAE